MINISALLDKNGYIKIAALDHRDSLKKLIPEKEILDFKTICIKEFNPYVTAVILNPEYLKSSEFKNIKKPFLVCLETSGYTETANGRISNLYEDFNAKDAKELGASATKLNIYYNPTAPAKRHQLEVIKTALEESRKAGLPFLLEIVTYQYQDLPYNESRCIAQSVEELKDYGDIIKINFCEDLEILCDLISIGKPWVLLSRGRKYIDYKKCLQQSKDIGGAVGFAVGRSLWQEVGELKSWKEREKFIKTVAADRLKELSEMF
ncbi:MAG: hypothetical protein ABII16_03485 [Patescibacteria group bacterium]